MSIMGDNAKLLNQSKNFVNSILENDYSKAFKYLSEDYQNEFFMQPLVFKYTLMCEKNVLFSTSNEKSMVQENDQIESDDILNDVLKITQKEKKICYIKRKFPFLPWSRGERIHTTFAIPLEIPNKLIYFLVELFNRYTDQIRSQFVENEIVLVKVEGEWKISELVVSKKMIGNIFLDKNYSSNAANFTDIDLNLKELEEIALHLEKNKVALINLQAFYDIILKKGNGIVNYLNSIKDKSLGDVNGSRN